jgi:hypothetical protein
VKTGKGGQWGYIDRTGRIVVPLEYEYAAPFINGAGRMKKGGKNFEADKNGKVTAK